MRKNIYSFILLILAPFSVVKLNAQHVVMISIDGLRPDFYLDDSWPAPNLRQLMKQGTFARHMRSVFPSYTYPSHTAMLTGALPARSGICYNAPVGSKGEWNWFTRDIKVPTLWRTIKSAGMTSAAIEWPVSVDPNITYNIPEIWDPKDPEDRITEVRKYATPGLIEEIESKATGKLDGYSMNEAYLSMDAHAGMMAAYIFRTYKPHLLAVHFAGVDGQEHNMGREGDSVRLAVAAADRAVGEVLEAIERSGLKDSCTVLIVGDHGFSDLRIVMRPNILIKGIDASFVAAGGSAFLYVKKQGAQRQAVIQSVIARLDSLPVAHRNMFRIIDRKELDVMGADSNAVLALAAFPGLVFSGAVKDSIFGTVKGGHHGYDPRIPDMYTGFIAAGAHINKGKEIPDLCVTDIAPLLARLLHLPFNAPDGQMPQGVLKDL